MSREPMPDLAEAVARHQYGPHRCVGFFSEGTDCIVVLLQAEVDRLRAVGLDVVRLRGAFIRAGVVWVLPADLFDETVICVAREYDHPPKERDRG